MLNDTEILVIIQGAEALTKHGEPGLAGLLTAIADRNRAARAKATQARAARQPSGTIGRPPAIYTVDAEPWWTQQVQGAKAAVDLVNEFLTAHGQRNPLSLQNMQVHMARKGHWLRLVETADGTVALSIRKAKSSEEPK